MSGDVQARKRKEKKRKKDEEDNIIPSSTLGNINENLTDNVTIHIYKESTTGGHWCARIIFFVILTMLVGLIGIVIFEHRGTTDISTPLESSRWAFIFEGWVDDSALLSNEESHDNEQETREIRKETKDYEDNKKITEIKISNEEKIQEDEISNEHTEEEKEIINENGSNEEQNIFQSKEEELNHENEYEDREDILEEDITPEEFDDINVLEEIYSISTEKFSDEKNILYEDSQFDKIIKMTRNEDEKFENFLDIPGVNEINDDNLEPLEEVENIEPEEYVNDVDIKPEIEEIEEESANVAMKFGIGVALIVAAHFVLVKRWNNEVIFVQNQSKLISSEKKDVEEKVTLKNKLIIQVEEYETGEQNKSKKIETKEEKRKIEIIKEQINLQQNDKIGEKEKEKNRK